MKGRSEREYEIAVLHARKGLVDLYDRLRACESKAWLAGKGGQAVEHKRMSTTVFGLLERVLMLKRKR